MIDFTGCQVNKYKAYGGGNGNKISIIYQNEIYMLKLAPKDQKKSQYTNACLSEYIGCHIYDSLGFKTQHTILGKYLANGKYKEAIACRDFETDGYNLMEFAKLKNACLEADHDSSNGYGTELSSVLKTIEQQGLIDPIRLNQFFWDMFITDAFLGNFDRHNGNWGILVNQTLQKADIAPIYDCGSCLYPQINEPNMAKVLSDPAEQDRRIFVFPTSALKQNDRKINYFDFISSNTHQECTEALMRIFPKINMRKIESIINTIPDLSDVRKNFYLMMLNQRKEKILSYSLERIKSFEAKICSGQYNSKRLCTMGEEIFNWSEHMAKQRVQEIQKIPRFKTQRCKSSMDISR